MNKFVVDKISENVHFKSERFVCDGFSVNYPKLNEKQIISLKGYCSYLGMKFQIVNDGGKEKVLIQDLVNDELIHVHLDGHQFIGIVAKNKECRNISREMSLIRRMRHYDILPMLPHALPEMSEKQREERAKIHFHNTLMEICTMTSA